MLSLEFVQFKFHFVIYELTMFMFNGVICVHCRDHLAVHILPFSPLPFFLYHFIFLFHKPFTFTQLVTIYQIIPSIKPKCLLGCF